ncbi:MAG: hypothetical protein P1U37_05575 [Minwuia sp.]|nr:hypothetical protein [Minwuia sp.]
MLAIMLLFRSALVHHKADRPSGSNPNPIEKPEADHVSAIQSLDWHTAFSEFSTENHDEDPPVAVNENTEPPSLCQGEKVSLRNMAAVIKWFDGKPAA